MSQGSPQFPTRSEPSPFFRPPVVQTPEGYEAGRIEVDNGRDPDVTSVGRADVAPSQPELEFWYQVVNECLDDNTSVVHEDLEHVRDGIYRHLRG